MGGEDVFVWSVEKETNKIKKPVDVRGFVSRICRDIGMERGRWGGGVNGWYKSAGVYCRVRYAIVTG